MSKRIYQFTIPLYLVSIIAGLLIADYFLVVPALADFTTQIGKWGSILSAFAIIYASVVLTATRIQVLAAQKSRKDVFRSVVYLITFFGFAALALTDTTLLTSSPTFIDVFSPTMSQVGMMVWVSGPSYNNWMRMRKLSRIQSLEALVLWIFSILRGMYGLTAITANAPIIFTIGDWARTVPYAAVQQAASAAAGVGGILLGVRALVGKEPGLVEMEITE
jgi:hypothetical protein